MIYDLLTGIGGAVWGANAHPDTVLPAGQPIDIVILNFDGNGARWHRGLRYRACTTC